MKKFLFFLILFLLTSCAHTAEKKTLYNHTLIFDLKINGSFDLSNRNITYYIVIYAPNNQTFDITKGPRINGPNLKIGYEFLEGRLPFTGMLANDLKSFWTDFFYLTGTSDGEGQVGRGRNEHITEDPSQSDKPVIYDRNYPKELWSVNDNVFRLKINLLELSSLQNIPKPQRKAPEKIMVNLAVSDNIDTGVGMVFDRWKGNIPFMVPTELGISERNDDIAELNTLIIPTRPYPQIPQGVNKDSLDIIGYEIFVPKN